MQDLPYIPAKHQGAERSLDSIETLVIHDGEIAEKPDAAEALANYFRNPSKPSSAHVSVDPNSAVRSVPDNRVAFAAPGANRHGKQYEQAGYARQTRAEWTDVYSTFQGLRLASLLADDCIAYRIWPRLLSVADLKSGRINGITTHANVSKAYGRSSHWDPGPHYPIEDLIVVVRQLVNERQGAAPVPPPPPAPVAIPKPDVAKLERYLLGLASQHILGRGDRGDHVRILQAQLNKRGASLAVDGHFGAATERVVRFVQTVARIPVDGIVGPATWRAITQ